MNNKIVIVTMLMIVCNLAYGFLYDEEDHEKQCKYIRTALITEANKESKLNSKRLNYLIEYMTVADCWHEGEVFNHTYEVKK